MDVSDVVDLVARGRLTPAQVAGLDPMEIEAILGLGQRLSDVGDLRKSIVCARGVLVLSPLISAAWVLLGLCHLALNEADAAQKALCAALVLKPDDQRSAWALVCAYLIAKNNDAAQLFAQTLPTEGLSEPSQAYARWAQARLLSKPIDNHLPAATAEAPVPLPATDATSRDETQGDTFLAPDQSPMPKRQGLAAEHEKMLRHDEPSPRYHPLETITAVVARQKRAANQLERSMAKSPPQTQTATLTAEVAGPRLAQPGAWRLRQSGRPLVDEDTLTRLTPPASRRHHR